MASADRTTEDVNFGSVQARTRDVGVAALSAIQQATSGSGPALDVKSDNSSAPAARVRGAGTLLDLQDSTGASQFAVTQTGVVTSGGALAPTAVNLTAAASTTDVITVKVTGDAASQLIINGNGRIEFGGGTDPVDVALFRDGSVRLHTVNDFVTEGNLICDVVGKGVTIKEGANARMGVSAAMVAGTVTISTTAVTANSRIFLTPQTLGTIARPAAVGVTTRTAATSFVITSGDATDTSTVAWMIVEPS